MLDELELLKKDWQRQEAQLPKLSYDDIRKMIWKKSSSLVKWIFYISIAEFVFWIALSYIPSIGDKQFESTQYTDHIANVLGYIGYATTLVFVILFYLNYKKISADDSSRRLMKNILKVRNTVKTYVWVSLGLFAASFLILITELIFFEPEFNQLVQMASAAEHPLLIYVLFYAAVTLIILATGAIVWLFYRLIYGVLLKRLNENFKELKRLEV